jgi:hypothetical protein
MSVPLTADVLPAVNFVVGCVLTPIHGIGIVEIERA